MPDLEIFENAPDDATPEELATYVDEACGTDKELRAEVEGLLGADGRLGSFMGKKALGDPVGPDIDLEVVGSVIGDYKLLQEIGHGGFGTVYMADQLAPVKRRVALKIIKLGMDTKQVVARFEVERQALAMMDHPNIAKVLDAGAAESGRPYFVMELVRGIPITQFCEEQKLDTKARLALFTDVCHAIQHAHQKGIIHRDLKPSNIIVTLHDDKAVPKVIDFGVAKATQQDLTDKTLFTQFEQFIGTPAYMSPEQAQMSGLDIDTRSDVYALGVLLYELLTGTTPFESKTLAASGYDEMRRVIREEEPPKPSTRLTEIERRTIAESEVSIVTSEIDQDLDWIVMKALEKDRTRRYETANGLAADIRRHLRNEPVEAVAPSSLYRLRKYARRNRRALITVGSIATLLVLGSLVSTWFGLAAVRASKQATAKGEEAERGRVEAQLLVAEEQLAAGKTALGIAHLARLIRQDKKPTIAAERLFSAIRQRALPELLGSFENYGLDNAALSKDGSMLTTASPDGQVCVRDTASGVRISALMETETDSMVYDVGFSPDDQWIFICELALGALGSKTTIWDWRNGTMVGAPLQIEGKASVSKFSPDGKLFLMLGNVGYIWDLETGQRCFDTPLTRTGFTGEFSPDSKMVAFTAGVLHDARTGHLLNTLPRNNVINQIRFSPDSKHVVTASSDGTARVWELPSGNLTGVLPHRDQVHDAVFSPDGNTIATASWDGTAKLWDAESKVMLGELAHDHAKVASVRFSPDSQWLITTSRSGQALVWNIHLGDAGDYHYGKVFLRQRVESSQDGKRLLTAGGFSNAYLWTVGVGQPRSQVFRHGVATNWRDTSKDVWVANFSPDGKRLVTGSVDNAARVWDAWTSQEQFRLPQKGWQWRAEFSSDGQLILTTGAISGVAVWSANTGKELCKVKPPGEIRHAALQPVKDVSGDYLFVVAPQGERSAQLYQARTGESFGPPLTHGGSGSQSFIVANNHRAMFRSDGLRVVTATDNGSARVWRVTDGELLLELSGYHRKYLESAVYSLDGKLIITASGDGTAGIWDAETGELRHRLPHSEKVVSDARFSPDGLLAVTTSSDGTARIWDTKTGNPKGLPLRHDNSIPAVRFSPDGTRIVTASFDGTARVWDAETGHALSDPLQHDGAVWWAVFSPDGSRVATAGSDSTAKLWDMPPAPVGPVPAWVPEWAEAIARTRISNNDIVTTVGTETWHKMKQLVEALPNDDFYAKTAKWFYEDKSTRLITPFSKLTVSAWVENRIKEDTLESLREAIRVSPNNPVALANLARVLMKSPHRETPGNRHRVRNLLKRAITLAPDKKDWSARLTRIEKEIEQGN